MKCQEDPVLLVLIFIHFQKKKLMAILSEVFNFNPQYYIFLVHFVKLIQTSLQMLKYC